MHVFSGPGAGRRIAAAIAAFVLAVLGAAYYLTYEPAPAVDIQWSEKLSEETRREYERRYGLVNPSHPARRSSTYDLLDTGSGNIRALLSDPAVQATNRFDPDTFTVRADAPYGESWMWVGDRLPLLRWRPVAWSIVGICVAVIAYALAGLAIRPRT